MDLFRIHLNHVKRCALFNYDTQTNSVEFRHYNIAVKPVCKCNCFVVLDNLVSIFSGWCKQENEEANITKENSTFRKVY